MLAQENFQTENEWLVVTIEHIELLDHYRAFILFIYSFDPIIVSFVKQPKGDRTINFVPAFSPLFLFSLCQYFSTVVYTNLNHFFNGKCDPLDHATSTIGYIHRILGTTM